MCAPSTCGWITDNVIHSGQWSPLLLHHQVQPIPFLGHSRQEILAAPVALLYHLRSESSSSYVYNTWLMFCSAMCMWFQWMSGMSSLTLAVNSCSSHMDRTTHFWYAHLLAYPHAVTAYSEGMEWEYIRYPPTRRYVFQTWTSEIYTNWY